jgi:hypothetical protein
VKTWRGRPEANSSGSDNLLTGVWAPVSCKYSLFGVQHSSGHQDLIDRGYAAWSRGLSSPQLTAQ